MKIDPTAIDDSGVTLIELLVVVSIVAILAVALAFSYQGWMGNYNIESETKQLYADLMDARTRAMARNRMHFVVVNANNYQIYEDTNDNNTAEPGSGDNPVPEFATAKTVSYSLGWTGTITFNTRGLTTSASAISIPINLPSGTNPDYDCVLVYQPRIAMGLMSGGSCVYK
jgi:prepilin-type N-terminal cleavage/methylation domain-containing protein